jgi:hypothetical protein
LSKNIDFSQKKPFEWVFGMDFSELEETNVTRDDGIYGDPSDPYGPYASESVISRNYKAENFSLYFESQCSHLNPIASL